jgi:DNA-binding SARP family transcriptional activator
MLETTSQVLGLELLGGAVLHIADRKPWTLERKTAGLLTYLALEGGTPRSRLAGLLWPDSIESTARNNLSQATRRLRETAGLGLITGDVSLSLNAELNIDVSRLELESFAGNDQTVVSLSGALLAGLDYDDCPEFQDWLLIKRETLLGLQREAHLRLSLAAELAGQSRLALEHAVQVLEFDSVSEVAHRHVMRLHYQNGDRGAALAAFEHCKQTLEQELGVAPLPETLALAAAISQGATVQQVTPTRLEIPLTVLRPPVLIGRDQEWAQLETAWNQGVQIVICGEPGIGKSRLMFDFAASHGAYLLIEGRPGDANVSFSSYARSLRNLIGQDPSLKFEAWVRSELSRLLPELSRNAPAALQSQEQKLRFFEAIACALESICQHQHRSSVIVDDLQFMDAASLEVQEYVVTRLSPSGLHFLNTHRSHELPASLEDHVQSSIAAGNTQRIEIKALKADQVSHWITSLEITTASDLAARLVKHTGGNPMFMLETIKSLVETNQLAQNTSLPTPTRVGALVRQRLERLSSQALRLARVAAITGTDYSLGLAAKILETNALELSEVAGELEQTQLMTGDRFAHDLIFEAVLADTPKTIKIFVHQQTATQLESSEGEPARIAHHWIEAGQAMNAVSHLEKATLKAVEQYQLREIVKHATQTAMIHEQANNPEAAWECWTQVRDVMRELAVGDELEVVIQALHRTASTPKQRAETLEAECQMWVKRGNLTKAKRIAEHLMEAGRELDDLHVLELAENNLGMVAWMQGKSTQAAAHFAASNEYGRLLLQQRIDLGAPQDEINRAKQELAMGFANHATILDNFGHYAEAELEHKQAIEMLRDVRDMITLNQELSNISITFLDQGRNREAIVYLQEANANAASLTESTMGNISQYATTSDAYLMLDQYTLALEYANRGRIIAEQAQHVQLHAILIRLGTLHRILGAVEQAKDFFETSLISMMENITYRNSLMRQYAVLLLEQNKDASAMALEALTTLSKSEHVFRWYKTHLELLSCLAPSERMPIVNETLKKPALKSMKGLHILALTRGAQTQLEFGKPKKALDFSQRAIDLLQNYEPDLQRAELLLAHQRALEANNHPDAPAHLERTLAWLLEVADHNVPPEYRQSFLERNPHNAAILGLARKAGLEILG